MRLHALRILALLFLSLGWAAAASNVTLTAQLDLPTGPSPYPLVVAIDGQPYGLDRTGRLEVELPAGVHRLEPHVDADVDGPSEVRVVDGESLTVEFLVSPRIRVEVAADEDVLREGESTTVTATVSTDFEGTLPLDLEIVVPDGVQLQGSGRLTAPLSARTPRELAVEALAVERGEYEMRAVLHDWAVEASSPLTVVRPATVEIELHADVPAAVPLEPISWQVLVRNTGDDPARDVFVEAAVPPFVEGIPLNVDVDLEPHEEARFELAGRATRDATGTITAEALATLADATVIAENAVPVHRGEPVVERRLPAQAVLPGDSVDVTLTVTNAGQAPLQYELIDTPPEWLEVAEEPRFVGVLQPGASSEHAYSADVRFGADTAGHFYATLTTELGTFEESAQLLRKVLDTSVRFERSRLRLGGSTTAVVTIANPTDSDAHLRLQPAADAALRAEKLPDELVLPPGEQIELTTRVDPDRAGTHLFELTLFNGPVPASFPASAELTVLDALSANRRSTITVPFAIEGSDSGELLIRHALPEGADYLAGTSTIAAAPVDEPLLATDADGVESLYWRLPFSESGELAYVIGHDDPIGSIAQPEMTLLVDNREIHLVGELTEDEFAEAAPLPQALTGLVRQPAPGTIVRTSDQVTIVAEAPYPGILNVLVNGTPIPQANLGKAEFDEIAGLQRQEYFGVPLRPGENTITAVTQDQREDVTVWLAKAPSRLELVPISLVADGSTPIAFQVFARDDNGIENGFGSVTIETNLEPHQPDAFPTEPGYQILLRDGRGTLELEPLTTVTRVEVEARFNTITTATSVAPTGRSETLLVAHGSATLRFADGAVATDGALLAYLETPVAGGNLQAAIDTTGPLLPGTRDSDRFPLTGAQGEASPGLESLDGLALKYDREGSSLGYYHDAVELPAVGDVGGEVTGLHADLELSPGQDRSLAASGFLALLARDQLVETIVPDGTRVYHVTRAVTPGSERVERVVGEEPDEERTRLRRGSDYHFDYTTGTIVLVAPLWHTTPGFDPVRLEVTYTPADARRELLSGGAGVTYSHQAFTVSAGFLVRDDWRVGVDAAYEQEWGEFGVAYRHDSTVGSQAELTGEAEVGPLDSRFSVAYDFGRSQLTARLTGTVTITEDLSAELEHRYSANSNETSITLSNAFGPLAIGLGSVLDWNDGDIWGLATAGWKSDGLNVSLQHRQSIRTDVPTETSLETSFRILDGLNLESSLAYQPGLGLNGAVDLVQEVGEAEFTVGYQLPGTSSRGNRARFGASAPLHLDEQWSIDLSAGYEHDLNGGPGSAASSVGFRFQDEDLTASLATDVSLAGTDPKVVVRGGASGVVDEATSLSFSATFEVVPEITGHATVANAYRDGIQSLLNYHRLNLGSDANVEGEVAYTRHEQSEWQFRPSVAYRVPLDAPTNALFQFSLGGNVYPLEDFSVGGALHYLLQPGHGSSRLALTTEAGYQLSDGLWLNAGYTFFGFEGLTADSQGFHIRIDLLGAEQ